MIMMTLRNRCLLAGALLTLLLSACNSGLSTEEASSECDRLRNDLVSCFTDTVYDQCVACHEECGRECSLQDKCPHEFLCDEP